MVGTAIAGYEVGVSRSRIELERVQRDLAVQHEALRQLGERTAAAEQEANAAITRHAQLLERQRAEALGPDVRRLAELAKQRVREGVPAARIELLIAAAGAPTTCEPEIESRRLLVHVPGGGTLATSASFFGERVIVTGEGSPMRPSDGRTGSGFDRSEPIHLRFLAIGGEVTSASGRLPLAHAIAVDGHELRFAVRASERDAKALEVSAQRCRLP